MGGFSMIQNMRQRGREGFEQRGGMVKLHTTADGGAGQNKTLSLFQYSKGGKTERHFYAQMSDSDVLEATNAPPTVTTGVFGGEVFSGSAGDIPASWGVIDDILLFSNGSDQHQIFTGNARVVDKFVVVKDSVAIPNIPDKGEDYSIEVSDGNATTVAILDSLGDLAVDYDAIYIGVPVPCDTFTWAFGTSKPNATASVAQIHYWNGSWTAVSGFTDNTANGTPATLAQAGTMTFTLPTDSVPHYQFGECMFWYRISLSSGDLDAEVEVSAVTFETDWQSVQNVWDGTPLDIIEAQFNDDSASTFLTFAASTIELDLATASDKIYFACAVPIVGFYVDVGEKPNTTGSTTINNAYSWDGGAWNAVSNLNDGSNGLSSSGWVTFTKPTPVHPTQFNEQKYSMYWYYFTVDKTLNDDVIIGLSYMPTYDINDMGRKGQCNAAWKNRAVYTFTQAPHYLYISALGRPMVLNGLDFSFWVAGDGRNNPIRAIKNFHNEIMVWQEERGTAGGCWTMFQGKSPRTIGKSLLHDKIGTLNAKTALVVDGVMTATATGQKAKPHGFTLSHYGVFKSDGTSVVSISDEIQNYFDPRDTTNCIRRGYEDEMWMWHDTSDNVLRLGLVTGSSATVPNTFPVYNLTTGTWSFDELGHPLSCGGEVEAASGDIPILQVAGGVNDGTVYRLNTTINDVDTAIDAYAQMEIDYEALVLQLDEFVLRVKGQAEGDALVTAYENGIEKSEDIVSMVVRNDGEEHRRERLDADLQGDHISLKFQNNVLSQSLYLLDLSCKFAVVPGR
ncbi:hypothetical protein LCGC14_0814210 [marine sediment metagenome]|uniref:Uncharacterized protein n=1 Tax=marine sediment metagenome TaxID=412755 RepID=A0A0F9STA2_9ZZZZ